MSPDHDHPLPSADDTSMFEVAPVSLWLEDASAIRTMFEAWRAEGMVSLREWLVKPDHLIACLGELKIVKVNRKTLDLFEAVDFAHLLANIDKIVTPQSLECIIEQFVDLWEGKTTLFGKTTNTTISGRALDVQLRASVLPGYEASWARILVTIEDVTDLETARRKATASEIYARGLFEHSPVPIWVKDFSGVKRLLDRVRQAGVTDLAEYFRANPVFADQCFQAIDIIDVNRQALILFAAKDKASLLNDPAWPRNQRYRDELKSEIIGLWDGRLFQQRDIVDQALDGRTIEVQRQMSVLPGYEADWAKLQVARIDISERKKAEAKLRYICDHDPLTHLYNRGFFIEQLRNLEATGRAVSVVMIDLNGLKGINDSVGHAAGDDLLRRTGRILAGLVEPPAWAARLGGDEFALVMPDADAARGQAAIRALERLVGLDNRLPQDCRLSLSVGAATGSAGERLEAVVSRADEAMYLNKTAFYAKLPEDAAPRVSRRLQRASA